MDIQLISNCCPFDCFCDVAAVKWVSYLKPPVWQRREVFLLGNTLIPAWREHTINSVNISPFIGVIWTLRAALLRCINRASADVDKVSVMVCGDASELHWHDILRREVCWFSSGQTVIKAHMVSRSASEALADVWAWPLVLTSLHNLQPDPS